jgi:3-phenylpropionate/trans-cinnamate dioxygenase ferredoxin reductase component
MGAAAAGRLVALDMNRAADHLGPDLDRGVARRERLGARRLSWTERERRKAACHQRGDGREHAGVSFLHALESGGLAPSCRPSAGKAFAKPTLFLASASDLFTQANEAQPVTNTNGSRGVVIVGGGLAGQRCAEALRRHGYDGAIRMVCAETHRPYDRPPLSKGVLAGSEHAASLPYRPAEWYEQHSVNLLLGVAATGLEPGVHRVRLAGGATLSYDRLLIATGSRPRTLPALSGYENVSVLRTIDDASSLRGVLAAGRRLAVIGAGFIGQEVAATARRLGAEVTMIEAAACPLAGVLGPDMGAWFSRLHETEGVEVLCRRTIAQVEGNGRVERVRLSDDRLIETDHIVVGIGVEADTQWLAGSGIEAERGVPVDPDGRTDIEGVYAAGDVAATYDPLLGQHVPGSHWEAAGRQGARAAQAMLGLEPGPSPATSFWTDQYGIRIQYLGRARLADRVEIDGDLDERSFTAIFSRDRRPVAALLVNRPRELAAARTMIEKGTR